MNTRVFTPLVLVLLIALQGAAEEFYYGIEIGGVVCGYSRIRTSRIDENGKELILLKQLVTMKLSALGNAFDSKLAFTYKIDPETENFIYHDSDIKQGEQHLWSRVAVDGDTVRHTGGPGDDTEVTRLPNGVVLENTVFFPHLKRAFVDEGLPETTISVYEVRTAKIHDVTYSLAGGEELELAGQLFDSVVLDRSDATSGLKSMLWIDRESGRILRTRALTDRISFLADRSIVKRIEVASLDDDLMADAGVNIRGFRDIERMKVRARLEPVGARPTSESLNVPGQKFDGTVTDNLVDGVFEIAHRRYDGAGAPPFPYNHSSDNGLVAYLESSDFVVSDDPVLRKKAIEITAGATDSWDAVKRLSHWVGKEIEYDIPGGGTPRRVFDTRSGECGGHSLLLASFCRSVGIPARVVWGCMYVSNGKFGQHAWNEVYMGDAGWIPVDATAFETDFVDSGHVRISEWISSTISFGPKEMQILEYSLGGHEMVAVDDDSGRYAPYIGTYRNTRNGNSARALVRDGSLAVDIPGAALFPLQDPGDGVRWKSAIGQRIHFEFNLGDGGVADEMRLVQVIELPRQKDPDIVEAGVPEDVRQFLGEYRLLQANADFNVFFSDDHLVVHDPMARRDVRIEPTEEDGILIDEFGRNKMEFTTDEDGKIASLLIYSINKFVREE